ncbi:MAG TPA: hypothetical protein DCQ30_04510 [Acidimicrobiaceae bacterium]|nr:hypothetical protein [Acidimicrobiaceae bacterium]
MTADTVGGELPPAPADPALAVPPEPLELRDAMHKAVVAGEDWDGAFGGGLAVGALLWDGWGKALEAGGLDRGAFDAVVLGYRRELWFWFVGERTWRQAVEGLAGRVLRRLPTA